MANMFEQIEKGNAPVVAPEAAATAIPAPSVNMFQQLENPRPVVPPPPKPADGISSKIEGFLRMASNALTLGGRDRVAGMLPGRSYKEEEARSEAFRKENPWTTVAAETMGGIVPAMGISSTLGRIVPSLAKATIPAIMTRESITGGAMPAIEDIIRGKPVDLPKAATGAALGGITSGGIAAMSGLVSPSAKMRRAGSDLTPVDKAAMRDLSATADRSGVPLNIPELARAAAPGRAAGIESAYGYNTGMKGGGIEARNFDQTRIPMIDKAVDGIKKVIGGGPATGVDAQRAAKDAINKAERMVSASAKPLYDAAADTKVPFDFRGPENATLRDARKATNKIPEIKATIKDKDPNSIAVLDQISKRMEPFIHRAETQGDPNLAGLRIDQKKRLQGAMDTASPDYAMARDTVSQGRSSMVEPLEAGPLGKIAGTTNPGTQAKQLFNVDSPNDATQAINAIERLRTARSPAATPNQPFNPNWQSAADNSVPRGLLATHVDEAAKGTKFGDKMMPTQESGEVIKKIVGDGDFGKVRDLVDVLAARSPAGLPRMENPDGPVALVFDALQNLKSGRSVKFLNDPANIEKLGTVGPIQGLLQSLGVSAGNEMAETLSEPLRVTVRKPAREKDKDEEKMRRASSSR